MKKKQRVFWTIVLLFDCVASVTSLCVAWFTSNQKANSGIGSIVATNGMTAKLKYFSSDKTSAITQYDYTNEECSYTYNNGICTNPNYTGTGTYTYSDNFIENSNLTMNINYIAPKYAYTFAVELSGGIPNATCTASMAKFYATYLQDANSKIITLARIASFNFYDATSAATDALKNTAVNSFLKTPASTNIKNSDNFFYGDISLSNENAAFLCTSVSSSPATINSTFELNSAGGFDATMYTFTLDSSGKGLIFFTLYFSNDSSTYYSYDSTNSTYTLSTTGDSDIYEDMKINFDSIVFQCAS